MKLGNEAKTPKNYVIVAFEKSGDVLSLGKTNGGLRLAVIPSIFSPRLVST